jgi:para-aminobenzoate synthetase component 1
MKVDEIEYIDPLELYAKLRGEARGPAFVIGGCGEGRRYSYIGVDPFLVLDDPADPFIELKEVMERFKYEKGPFPFSGGAVGYFSYDLREKIFNSSPTSNSNEPTTPPLIPDSMLALFDPIIVSDHKEKKTYIVERGIEGGAKRARDIKALLKDNKKAAPKRAAPPESIEPISNLTKEDYISKVKAAKRYIAQGDIYQINIAQKFLIPWTGDPFTLYKAVVEKSPAPFSTYMDFDTFQIISNSPERLLKTEGRSIRTEPIKGTRRRGASKSEDLALIEELKKSPKERAEHVMIVDLERNDLGMICETGSVKVEEFEQVLTLPGLHHMVSVVTGRIKDGLSSPECLRAIFPGGSITGAPKIRAMEIIDELEPEARGLYTGALGWMDFSGEMDISMAIRTAIYKDEAVHLSVGSGIVIDSIPESEYDETILKAGDLFSAINDQAMRVNE